VITVDFHRLTVKPHDRILDVGCGSGRHTCAASRQPEVIAVGADLRWQEVSEARDRLAFERQLGVQQGSRWAVVVADMRALPFKTADFDLVICSEVLEHVPEHEKAASELCRVLKKGGDLVVSVPRYLPERICWSLSRAYHTASDGHVRIYRKSELLSLLVPFGFTPWSVHFAHSLHTPYWWLKCLVGPTREDSRLVNAYHRFLVWDMMKGNRLTRLLDRLLNPLMGKSIVLYLRKGN